MSLVLTRTRLCNTSDLIHDLSQAPCNNIEIRKTHGVCYIYRFSVLYDLTYVMVQLDEVH